jgi:hypothetical protein
MARKKGQVIGRSLHIWLARVCMLTVARLPKNPELRLSANG